MHGMVARSSKIRSQIGERIADLRDSLVLTRELLCRAVAENAPEDDMQKLRNQVVATLDAIEKLHSLEHRRLSQIGRKSHIGTSGDALWFSGQKDVPDGEACSCLDKRK
jgi:hypothetical protein